MVIKEQRRTCNENIREKNLSRKCTPDCWYTFYITRSYLIRQNQNGKKNTKNRQKRVEVCQPISQLLLMIILFNFFTNVV